MGRGGGVGWLWLSWHLFWFVMSHLGYNRTRSMSNLGSSELQPDVRARLWPSEAANRKKQSSLKYSASQPRFTRSPSLLSMTGASSTVLQPEASPMKLKGNLNSASQSTILFDSGAATPAAPSRHVSRGVSQATSDEASSTLAATDGKGHLNLLITLAFSRDEKFQRQSLTALANLAVHADNQLKVVEA